MSKVIPWDHSHGKKLNLTTEGCKFVFLRVKTSYELIVSHYQHPLRWSL